MNGDVRDGTQAVMVQRSARPIAGLTDLALGKTATQSSLSEWSHDGEASDAVSAVMPDDFAFHTSEEDSPWWEIDLGGAYPLEAIIIHNRRAMLQSRARTLRVEIAERSGEWTLVHGGYASFGSGCDGHPLELWIGSDLVARYVRLSLAERQILHLAKVQVLARPDRLALRDYCVRYGFPLIGTEGATTLTPYTIERNPKAIGADLVGLRISYSGRFGNLLHQYINAIHIAERTGLKYIQLGRHALLDVKEQFDAGGITFLPPDAPLPVEGSFISGEFFNSDDFAPVLSPFLRFTREDEVAATTTTQRYIVPHMLTGIPLPGELHPEDELTIHLRAGDIFDCDEPVTFGYRQPPLSFYQLVIGRMRAAGRITRARLVYEDRGNPCIDALAAWLDVEGVPYRVQCGTLHEDMSALIDAPHLVFGHGTFGYAACRLSKRIKTVHFFAPELGGSYADMPNVDEVFAVHDTGGYIKAYEYGKPFDEHDGWRNTPQMRELMLSYPIEKLGLEKVRSSKSS